MKVAVVGSGPAGLLAVHEAFRHTKKVDLFSLGTKSALYGAQYLHAPIEGITPDEPEAMVDYRLLGTAEAYRAKVYGSNWDGRVSPDEFGAEEAHPAWDIRRAYETMWRLYSPMIQATHIKPNWMHLHQYEYDVVFYSAPAQRICADTEHKFHSQSIYAIGDSPYRPAPRYDCPNNTILCSGWDHDIWYRVSCVFNYATAEYPATVGWVPPGVVSVQKPLSHTCDCFPNVVRIGRYGAWRKGYLVHEVKDHVRKVLS